MKCKILRPMIIMVMFVISLCLPACNGAGGGGIANSNGANKPVMPARIVAVTIDSAGVVPLVNNQPTSSVIYVHNNTDHTIANITYRASSNQGAVIVKGGDKPNQANSEFIDPDSARQCGTISAHGFCSLGFTVPSLSGSYSSQGSTVITASYVDAKVNKSFSQMINYAVVETRKAQGVQIMSPASIQGFGDKVGYATVYAYGTGNLENYQVKSLSLSSPSVVISNGNVIGSTIQSNFVQAIELTGQISDKNTFVNLLKLQSTNKSGESFISQADLMVTPSVNSQIMVGLIPAMDVYYQPDGIGVAMVANPGPNDIVNFQVFAQTLTIVGPGCGTIIPAGSTCTIKFKLPEYGGSDVLNFSGIDAVTNVTLSATQSVVWFNSKSGALLTSLVTPDPLVVVVGATGGRATVTIQNLGGFTIQNLDVSGYNVMVGNARVTVESGTCTGSLGINSVCSYTVSLNDGVLESGSVYIFVKGKYQISEGTVADYSRVGAFKYVTEANSPALTISQPHDMAIQGNNVNKESQVIKVTNNGTSSTNIDALTLTNTDPKINASIIGNDCTKLDPGNSCLVNIMLGPQLNASTIPITSASILTVDYAGRTKSQSTGTFITQVYPNVQDIIIKSISATGSSSGSGTTVEPYIFSGADASNKSITITYQNNGTDKIQIKSFTQSFEPMLWEVAPSLDTCSNGAILNPKDSCSISYNNLFARNIASFGNVGAVYSMNLPLPTLKVSDFSTGNTYSATPLYNDFNTIGVEGHQATVANSVLLQGNNQIVVAHNLANASDYKKVGLIKIISTMESYFTGIPVPSSASECSVSIASGKATQTCTFNNIEPDGTENLNVTYTLANSRPRDTNVKTLFEANSSLPGTVFAMSPQSFNTLLPNPPLYMFMTANGYNGDMKDGGGSSIVTPKTTGEAGADAICQAEAYAPGSKLPTGFRFKALLVTESRYPCDASGLCGGKHALDWPVVPKGAYLNPDNTNYPEAANANGVFLGPENDSNPSYTPMHPNGNVPGAWNTFWTGIQSVHTAPSYNSKSNPYIDAWAYADVNPQKDATSYEYFKGNCNNYTVNKMEIGSSIGVTEVGQSVDGDFGSIMLNTWGNYGKFSDFLQEYTIVFNLWSFGFMQSCVNYNLMVCVSN